MLIRLVIETSTYPHQDMSSYWGVKLSLSAVKSKFA